LSLQYGIKEVLNVVMEDLATGKPIIDVDYAETTTIETTAERIDVRGGHGYYKLLTFDHSKEAQLQMTLPLVDLKLLALLGGTELAEKQKDVFSKERLTVKEGEGDDDNYVELSYEPVEESLFVAELEGNRDFGDEIDEEGYNLDGKKITLPDKEPGDRVVVFYKYSVNDDVKEIKLSAERFPRAVKIYGNGLWTDEKDKSLKKVKVTVHEAIPQSEFTVTMSGDEATELELTFDLFAVEDDDGDLTYVTYDVLDETATI